MKKSVFVFGLFAVLVTVAVFAAGTALKIALVTDVGGVNDQSFNQGAWEGLKLAQKDLGVAISYKESKNDAEYASNFDTMFEAKNDLIWGIGFLMGDAILAAAEANPTQKYAIIDYAYATTPKNLIGVVFKAEEASFLVGYIAGKMTKTNKIGFVGGMNIPVIPPFEYGFIAGVKYANPKAVVVSQYAESFTDAAKGKSIATSMYNGGCDIVFHAAGGVGNGVIEAAKDLNKYAIGVDKDQNYLAPKNVITSAMKRVDKAVYNVAKALKDNKFPGGTTVVYGLADGGVDIAPTSSALVPAAILKEVDALKAKVIAGSIVVPNSKDSYEAGVKKNFAK